MTHARGLIAALRSCIGLARFLLLSCSGAVRVFSGSTLSVGGIGISPQHPSVTVIRREPGAIGEHGQHLPRQRRTLLESRRDVEGQRRGRRQQHGGQHDAAGVYTPPSERFLTAGGVTGVTAVSLASPAVSGSAPVSILNPPPSVSSQLRHTRFPEPVTRSKWTARAL